MFDLGNVLVKVHWDKFRNAILSYGVDVKTFDDYFSPQKLRQTFESGNLSSSQFLKTVKFRLGDYLTVNNFEKHFTEMFSEIAQMKQFLRRLSRDRKFKMILLSNTNPIHFHYIKKNYPYLNFIKHNALSYKLKLLKPDSRIYRKVLRQYKIKANETIFIDDLQDNCKCAVKLGFHVIHYTTYYRFIRDFTHITE